MRILVVSTVLAVGALAVGCSDSDEATSSSPTTAAEGASAVTVPPQVPAVTADLRDFMPTADTVAPGAKVLDEGDGTAPAVHGLLGREGKSYKFQTRAFGVDSLPHSSGPALVVARVEQWANESDPGRRLYDWLIEPTGSVADTIAGEERRGFLARLAAFGIKSGRIEVERRTLPPGLGHSSVGGVIHFDAMGKAFDDGVVLFSCGPFVGSADLIGRRGAVDLKDSLQIASLIAGKMGDVCA